MKYTVGASSASRAERLAGRRKPGFFESERGVVEDIWRETGLTEGLRHPLTYVMEASDDIAYCVIDTEDAVKKGLVSYQDVLSFIRDESGADLVARGVVEMSEKRYAGYRTEKLSPGELNDLSMQMFRVDAMSAMVPAVTDAFVANLDALMRGTFESDLIANSKAASLCEALKKFDKRHAYQHESVRRIELLGHNTIHGLMDLLWPAITNRETPDDLSSARKTPFDTYVYSRISENYRRVFENPKNSMPRRYKEAQLLTDMISGMTDKFAIDLLGELRRYAA
jgi:dGTPase